MSSGTPRLARAELPLGTEADGFRSRPAGAAAVRLHHRVPHHLSELHHRAVGLYRDAARDCLAAPAATATSGSRGSGPRSSRCRSAWASSPGVVLSYELGTNWSRFSRVAGNIIGPLAGYEVLSAFFLEATFLAHPAVRRQARAALAARALGGDRRDRHRDVGVLDPLRQQLDAHAGRPRDARRRRLPGRLVGDRVQPELPLSPRPHAQRLLSHRGLRRAGGRRALPARRATTSRRRAPCCAWRSACWRCWRRCRFFIGDQHGLNTLKHQPTKIAAMEAHWDGTKPGDFHIFAWPDEKAEKNRFAISIPRGSSLILTHDPNGLFPGLEGRAAAATGRRSSRCSSPSASCSRSASS